MNGILRLLSNAAWVSVSCFDGREIVCCLPMLPPVAVLRLMSVVT